LTFSKLTKEANIEIWNTLGFDPPRWDVWPELKNHPNRFTEYFANDFFAVLADIKDEIQSPNVGELTPVIKNKMLSGVLFDVLVKRTKTAKEFLTFSKLSKEASIEIWNTLGFDPPRWDVWPELKNHPNRFTEYFANDFFAVLADIKDEILSPYVGELTPVIKNKMLSSVFYDVLVKRTKTPKEALTELANELRNQ